MKSVAPVITISKLSSVASSLNLYSVGVIKFARLCLMQ